MRDKRPNNYSIERLYDDVRHGLPVDCAATVWHCRNPSKGFWPRLIDGWAARRGQGDVNHVTGDTHYLTFFLQRERTVTTIHDLVSVERSTGFKRFVLWFFWFWLPVARSRKLITVSDATRQALLRSVCCDPGKVEVIHNPVSKEFQPVELVFNDACPHILQVGTKANKNIERVAQALEGMQCKLVIIGPLATRLKKFLATYEIDYENYVNLTRAELLKQYVDADMLIFASTFEGFGMPIAEANAVGRPVVTSNFGPMTEVAADSACLVDPYSPASIRAGVERIIQEPVYREALVTRGFRNVQRFKLETVAAQYAEVYRQIAREP